MEYILEPDILLKIPQGPCKIVIYLFNASGAQPDIGNAKTHHGIIIYLDAA